MKSSFGPEAYHNFASAWESAWNAHALDEIMSHYAPDVVFRSRKAQVLMGAGVVCGQSDLRAYWAAALERQPDLHFTVHDVFCGHQMMVIAYTNHRGVKAVETLRFDENGLVVEASACHRE